MSKLFNVDKLKEKLADLKHISHKAKPSDLFNTVKGMVNPDSIDLDYASSTVLKNDLQESLTDSLSNMEAVVTALVESNNEQQQVLHELNTEIKRLQHSIPTMLSQITAHHETEE